MTDMVYRVPGKMSGEPLLPRWWRTLDKGSLAAVLMLFAIGILLGLAASPPLAARNDLPQFYYVYRQAQFGAIAFAAILIISKMPPSRIALEA